MVGHHDATMTSVGKDVTDTKRPPEFEERPPPLPKARTTLPCVPSDGDCMGAMLTETMPLYTCLEKNKATMQWFHDTAQYDQIKKENGEFAEWFHGIIPRMQAEKLLKDKPVGSFLMRVSESRFGYSLSFRAEDRCRHYFIEQTTAGKFFIVGEPKAHKTLRDLITHYTKHKISNWNGLLTVPCGQEKGSNDYADLLQYRVKRGESEKPTPIRVVTPGVVASQDNPAYQSFLVDVQPPPVPLPRKAENKSKNYFSKKFGKKQ